MHLDGIMDLGPTTRILEPKNRVTVPKTWLIKYGSGCVITCVPDTPGTLFIISQSVWDLIRYAVGDDVELQVKIAQAYYVSAVAVTCDENGRFTLNKTLCKWLHDIQVKEVLTVTQTGTAGVLILSSPRATKQDIDAAIADCTRNLRSYLKPPNDILYQLELT